MSLLTLVEMENGIDHWLNRSLRQQWYNFFCECGGDRDLLLQGSRAKHSTDDMETFAQDLIEVDISLAALPQKSGRRAWKQSVPSAVADG